MKTKLIVSIATLAVSTGLSQAAITVSIKNFTSVSAGNPIVDVAAAAVAKNTIYASAGIFTSTPDWATATAGQILAAFTAIDSTPLVNSGFTGLFTGADTSTLSSYATGFENAQAYMVVGNNSTLANSSLIAVYKPSGVTYTPTVAGVASVAINATTLNSWVYGKQVTVTTQPGLANAAFTTGIQLTSVPEASTALLGAIGALGLLRRRRN